MARIHLLLALSFAAAARAGEAPLAPGVAAAAVAVAPAVAHRNFAVTQAGRHVTVWYFVPEGATPRSPVVFVMPGVKRNGEDYLKDWQPLAQARTFVLVVPEFSTAEFPGYQSYNFGNTVDAAGHAVPREQWSFSFIEPIFDAVRERTGNRSERYLLYGHSAGGWFVQRFLFFVPSARVARAVSANAGLYLLPDRSVAFPYGLKDTPVSDDDLRRVLALPLVVLLGTADTDPKSRLLWHTPEAEAQGPHRLARGQFFFAAGEAAARARHLPFGWQLTLAPAIGHSDEGMAPFAVQALFGK